jgi:hypothetical protein
MKRRRLRGFRERKARDRFVPEMEIARQTEANSEDKKRKEKEYSNENKAGLHQRPLQDEKEHLLRREAH